MTKYSDAGKGDAPRKTANHDAYSSGYDRIFTDGGPLARKKRLEALDELTRLSQEMGLYDEPPERNSSNF